MRSKFRSNEHFDTAAVKPAKLRRLTESNRVGNASQYAVIDADATTSVIQEFVLSLE